MESQKKDRWYPYQELESGAHNEKVSGKISQRLSKLNAIHIAKQVREKLEKSLKGTKDH